MPVFPGLNVSGRIMSNFNILSRGINVYDSQNNGVADIRNDGNGSMYLYS